MSQVALRTTTIFHRSALHRIALMFGDQKRYPTLKLQTSPEPQVLHFNLEFKLLHFKFEVTHPYLPLSRETWNHQEHDAVEGG